MHHEGKITASEDSLAAFIGHMGRLLLLSGTGRCGKATGYCQMVVPKWHQEFAGVGTALVLPTAAAELQQRTEICLAVKCSVRYQ